MEREKTPCAGGRSASVFDEGFADTSDEGGGIKFGAENLVGAVGQDGYAPVAHEGDELAGVDRLDFRAEAL